MSARGKVAAILLVALLLRLVSNHWLTVPPPGIEADALWYHSTATSLAQGLGYIHHFTREPTAAWPPGYPAILALLYRAFGPDAAWAYLLNAVAGTATCWLAGRIALTLVSARAQLLATALLALTPSQILFASLVMSETVFTAWMTALVLGAVHLVRQTVDAPSPRLWLLWGIATGIASLVRAEAVVLLLAPLLVLAARRTPARTIAIVLAMATLGIATAQLPWLVRNARLFGRVVPVSTSFGRTLLIGHNPQADGGMNLYSPDAAADTRDLATGGPAGEVVVDDRLRQVAVRFMREHPQAEVRLIGKRLWNMYRGDREWSQWYVPAPATPVSAAAIDALGYLSNLYYWLLLLLAAPAFARFLVAGEEGHLLVPVVAITWTLFFGVVLYGSERFHFPLLPLFCVMAADTLSRGGYFARK